MAKTDEEFIFESLQDKESIAKFLDALNNGFSKGKLMLGSKKKSLLLEPQGIIKFDVEGKRKNGQIKLKLKFSWKEGKKKKDSADDQFVIKS